MEPSLMDAQLYISQIDLMMEGLDEARQLVLTGEIGAATEWLGAHLRGRVRAFRPMAWRHVDAEDSLKKATLTLDGKVALLNAPLLEIGRPINWLMRADSDPNWTQQLSEQEWLAPLVHAYEQTGDDRFAARWLEIVEDFLDHHDYGCEALDFTPSKPMVFAEGSGVANGEGFYRQPDGRRSDRGSWTAPICARRARSWLLGLSRIGGNTLIETKRLFRILSSIVGEHTQVLINNPHEDSPSDFALGAAALLEIAIILPEFSSANAAFTIAFDRIEHSMRRHMFADGSDVEQSLENNAELVSLLKGILEILGDAPRARRMPLHDAARRRIRFLAYAATPLRQMARVGQTWHTDLEPLFREWTDFFELDDVRFIATSGKEGAEPPANSAAMPFGGYIAMRSDWEKDAHFLLFKTSDFGAGLMHEDCLSVNVTAGGRDLLVDSGHFSLNQQAERDRLMNEYAVSSLAHNTLIIDGAGQCRRGMRQTGRAPDLRAAEAAPLQNRYLRGQFFEYAEGEYADGYGAGGNIHARHQRRVLWLRGRGWIVLDTLRAKGEHDFALLWHLGPDFLENDVASSEEFMSVWTESPGQNLALHFLSGTAVHIDLFRGQESPPRGWCFRSYGERVPKTDVQVSWRGEENQIIATYIQPYGPESRLAGPVRVALGPDGEVLEFQIDFEDGITFEGRAAIGAKNLSVMGLSGQAELVVAARLKDEPNCVGIFGADRFPLGKRAVSGNIEARHKTGAEWDPKEFDAMFALGGGPSTPVDSLKAP